MHSTVIVYRNLKIVFVRLDAVCTRQVISEFELLILVIYLVGSLIPNGTVIVGCGSGQTFTCRVPRKQLGWNITGLSGINIPGPFLARNVSQNNPRISSNDTGRLTQTRVSVITISGFSISDNGGIIQCVNMRSGKVRGMATISVGE